MFRALRDEVEGALEDGLRRRSFPATDLGIEEPPEDIDGVLASNVSFRLSADADAPPPAVAEEIADSVDAEKLRYVDRIETRGPYLNFVPSEAYYADTVESAIDEGFGALEPTGESIVVEHTSANPTGPIHVGRARNPIIGDAIARLLAMAGHDVDRHYYVNDVGRQMAMFTWAYETFDESDLDREPARDRIEYDLVRYYRKGSSVLEEGDPETVADAESEIESIMKGLDAGDEATYERVGVVVDQVLEGMKACLGRLPAEFDEFVKESEFILDGSTEAIIEELKALECSLVEDDAWQLDLGEYGIEKNLVFLRSNGTSLYPTRDIAHHVWKLDNYDRAVTVLGEDHELQAEQVRTALSLLSHDTDRLEQVLYSYVNLPDGDMSTRKGTGIDLDDLLDEAIDRARSEVEVRLDDRLRDDALDEAAIDRIAEQVGVGAVRYDIVSKQPAKSITFEWDRALDFEAQSAPYVQYVHARCCGILEESDIGVDGSLPAEVDTSLLSSPEEIALIETIARFPAVVETAAADLEPHQIASYTREIAERFNGFYRACPVLHDDVDPQLRSARLALVGASRHTVANALSILGVSAPRSM